MKSPPPWLEDGPQVGHARGGSDALGERTFRQHGEDRFTLAAEDLGVSFEVTRLRRERGSLIGELTVRCEIAGAPTFDGILSAGDIYLTNPKARQERARLLNERARTSAIDFASLLEELALRVIAAERRGQPAILLRDAVRATPDDVFEVAGFPLLKQHPIIVYGDGGTGKSMLALWFAGQVAARGIPTAVFDWELSAEDHRDRFERLFGEDMPPLLYVRCARPLVFEIDRLRRVVQDNDLQFAIFDSVAFACDGPPEAAEVASRYLGAVRGLNLGSLHVAHVNKSEQADAKPFGSSFWHNGARATWFVKLADQGPDEARLSVGLFNKKSNLGRKRPALGYTLAFDSTSTVITRTDLADVESLAVQLPLRERLRHLLRTGPLTIAELSSALDAKPDSVEKALRRSQTFVRLISPQDGVHRYGLAERRAS